MGPEMPCYRPELAPGLAGSHPVLFLPGEACPIVYAPNAIAVSCVSPERYAILTSVIEA